MTTTKTRKLSVPGARLATFGALAFGEWFLLTETPKGESVGPHRKVSMRRYVRADQPSDSYNARTVPTVHIIVIPCQEAS